MFVYPLSKKIMLKAVLIKITTIKKSFFIIIINLLFTPVWLKSYVVDVDIPKPYSNHASKCWTYLSTPVLSFFTLGEV